MRCLNCKKDVQKPNGTFPKKQTIASGDEVMECPHCKKKNVIANRDGGKTMTFRRTID